MVDPLDAMPLPPLEETKADFEDCELCKLARFEDGLRFHFMDHWPEEED